MKTLSKTYIEIVNKTGYFSSILSPAVKPPEIQSLVNHVSYIMTPWQKQTLESFTNFCFSSSEMQHS